MQSIKAALAWGFLLKQMQLLKLLLLLQICRSQDIPITCQKDGDLALTFDGGPSMHTGQLLRILSKHNVKASFHLTPGNFDHPVIQAYVKRAASDGHLLGLYINDGKNAQKEIDRGRAALLKYAGRTLRFVRLPMPLPEPRILKAIADQGLTITSFNFDSMDYHAANRTAPEAQGSVFWSFKELFDAIDPPSKGAFISVQRDIVAASVAATDQIISYAKKRGYNFVRLYECIQSAPEEPPNNVNELTPDSTFPNDPKVKPHANSATIKKLDIAVIFVVALLTLIEM